MEQFFIYDGRLGIALPSPQMSFEEYDRKIREEILFTWEKIRGSIPDRIKELEHLINEKQNALSNETNFVRSCELNSEIADLASIINDLWLWYRYTDAVDAGKAHN